MAFKRSAVRSRLSPPPERERFSPLPFFSFYAAFRPLHPPPNKAAEAPRSRSPSPAAADAPESGTTARKAAPQPASMRVSRNEPPTHRRKRETRGAPAFGFLAVRFFNSAAVTPHAAKNSPAGSALFHAVIRCALLLTTTTAAESPTAKTPAPDVGERRRRAADALTRRQFPQNRASECPFARTHPRQNGHTQAACQKRIRLPAKHIKP